MKKLISVVVAVLVVVGAASASAQTDGATGGAALEAPSPEVCDNRPVINKKSLKMRGYEVVEQVDLAGFGPGWTAVLLTLRLPEAALESLTAISRLYILEGDRIEFDSFAFDAIEDGIEPSVNTRTFFNMKWEIQMRGKSPSGLILTGIVPRQAPGSDVRTASRTLVLRWSKSGGFSEAADVISCDPARVSGGIMTVPIN